MTLKYSPVRRAPSAFLLRAGGEPGLRRAGGWAALSLSAGHISRCFLLQPAPPPSSLCQERKTSLPRGREIPIPHALRSVILFYTPRVLLVIFAKCQTSNYYFSIDFPRTALCTDERKNGITRTWKEDLRQDKGNQRHNSIALA